MTSRFSTHEHDLRHAINSYQCHQTHASASSNLSRLLKTPSYRVTASACSLYHVRLCSVVTRTSPHKSIILRFFARTIVPCILDTILWSSLDCLWLEGHGLPRYSICQYHDDQICPSQNGACMVSVWCARVSRLSIFSTDAKNSTTTLPSGLPMWPNQNASGPSPCSSPGPDTSLWDSNAGVYVGGSSLTVDILKGRSPALWEQHPVLNCLKVVSHTSLYSFFTHATQNSLSESCPQHGYDAEEA